MEDWVDLRHEGFPRYEVSSLGRIRNSHTERILKATPNQSGLYRVGLVSQTHTRQVTRSVPLLVARTFIQVDSYFRDRFDTPINVNGLRSDNCVPNLMWRPYWFAVQYHQQFRNGRRGFLCPIRDMDTGEEFETSWVAALKYGLLDRDIMHSVTNGTPLFPTGQHFELI